MIHFFPSEDITPDAAVLVTYAGGIEDLWGNVSEAHYFRFLSEYRPVVSTETVNEMDGIGDFWQPGGSGSTSGIVNDESTISNLQQGPAIDRRTSLGINYVFDEYNSNDNFLIRDHNPKANSVVIKSFDGVVTMWVYGDGSNNAVNLFMRVIPSSTLKMRGQYMPVDFRGWNLFVFDLNNDEVGNFTGDVVNFEKQTRWYLDAVAIKHERTEEDDEEVPYQEWTGTIGFNHLTFTKWDDTAERTAMLTDVDLPGEGVVSVDTDANAPVEYYNLQGIRVANPSAGIYIRRQGNTATKVVIK